MEEMGIRIEDILKILKSRWKVIVSITFITALLAGIISFFVIKPVYEVDTKVFIGKDESLRYYEDYDNSDVLMYQNLLKTYSELFKSNDLIEAAINKNDLDITSEEVINDLDVNPSLDTQILEIHYQNTDNEVAKEVLVSVVDEFIQYTKELIPNGRVKVIESAKLPEYPVKPNKEKNIISGCLVGLVIGSIIAFLCEYMDNTIKTKEQVEKVMGIPVIGMIPCEEKKYAKKNVRPIKDPVSA